MLDGEVVGIISGASSVWAVAARDAFFGLNKSNRRAALPSIINNVTFRLEVHHKNLATQTLALWRRTIGRDWQERYGVKVAGFETFVVEEPYRKGALYLADNWVHLGNTTGRTKEHAVAAGLKAKAEWRDTPKKMIFAKKVEGVALSTEYHSAWRRDATSRRLPGIKYGEKVTT